jgi:hypothetical protein
MSTQTETPPAEKQRPPDPIPGYKLLERIGAGGYGEVWRASVPGDLTKAVKLVYGQLGEKRAASELKSLNRIKEVRHPFLLSLERIEIVDGRLVIVSELADSSLRELLDECQKAGMPGVPRDRLTAFLKDAADVLDYLCEEHGLQHLDIKPENLLLVGGRVKVADFGLVRELFDATASLLGGLTPVYAPPEVFDGAPGRFSDQYSLAIVYQELLTGTLPFTGRTAAQLAAQHMHSPPRLDAVPPADRPTIIKALSKDPAKRFPNCRAMIDSLIDGLTAPAPRSAPTARILPRGSRPSVGPMVAKTQPINARKLAAQVSRLEEHGAVQLEQLPPVDLANTEFRCRPTLIVGVGGTGSAVLQGLKARLRDRFDNFDQVPAFQWLLLDTDRAALTRANDKTRRGALDVQETLALPLRASQDYRPTAHRFLSWMSRRWIYNVPRSLTTEGLRPIGRLALADHAEAVKRRLQSAVAAACDPSGVTKSSERTGLKFDGGCPQVFLVGSISGGSGSGMLLDLAYLLRQILGERGFHEESIFGILSHATDRHSNRHDLAVANALAFLVELNHYSQPAGHFPGEVSSGVASYSGSTFSHTYLVHLGDDLTHEAWKEATEKLAEYTYRNIATTASRFFHHCRAASDADSTPPREIMVRSFGVCQIGCTVSDMPAAAAVDLCRRMVDEWQGESKNPEVKATKFCEQRSPLESNPHRELSLESSTDRLAAEQATALELNAAKLTKVAAAAATSELGRSPEDFFERLVEQFHAKRGHHANPDAARVELLDIIDKLLGTGGEVSGGFVPLQDAVGSHIDGLVDERGAILRDWIHRLADTSRARLKGAAHAAQWFIGHLESVGAKLNNRVDELSDECDAVRQALVQLADPAQSQKSKPVDPHQGAALVARYFHSRFAQVSAHTAQRIARRLAEVKLSLLGDQIRDLARELGNIAEQFNPPTTDPQPPSTSNDENGVLDDIHQTARESLDRQLPELAAELESLLFHGENALSRLLANPAEVNADFVERTRTAARSLIHRALKRVNVANVVLPSIQGGGGAQQFMEAAAPGWSACSGGKRLLVVAPSKGERETFESQLGESVKEPFNLIFDADNDLLFCYETEAMPLAEIAHEIMQSRHDLAQVADRLHTRIDVDWISM